MTQILGWTFLVFLGGLLCGFGAGAAAMLYRWDAATGRRLVERRLQQWCGRRMRGGREW